MGGRVVFVEYRAEDAAVAIKPLHKLSEPQIRREATAHGLKWERSDRIAADPAFDRVSEALSADITQKLATY